MSVKITDLAIIPELRANSLLIVDEVQSLVTHSVDMANIVAFTANAVSGAVLINADGGTPSTIYGGISPIDGGSV